MPMLPCLTTSTDHVHWSVFASRMPMLTPCTCHSACHCQERILSAMFSWSFSWAPEPVPQVPQPQGEILMLLSKIHICRHMLAHAQYETLIINWSLACVCEANAFALPAPLNMYYEHVLKNTYYVHWHGKWQWLLSQKWTNCRPYWFNIAGRC